MKKEKILIAGGSGLVGSYLTEYLFQRGYQISILSRTKKSDPKVAYFTWDLDNNTIEKEALRVDYIINLTGAGIMDKKWTDNRKKEIIDSRVMSNQLIASGLKELNHRPKAFIAASATGIYGNRGEEILTEESELGENTFVVDCCKQWELASRQLTPLVDKISILRIGLVLTSQGGVLDKFLLPLRLGQANYFGDGKNFYCWIHIEDLAALFYQCIKDPKYSDEINAISPNPITAKSFIKEIKSVIASYALLLPIPKFMMQIVIGERVNLLTNSTRVVPKKLLELGHPFKFTDLAEAIRDLVKRGI